MKELKVRDPGFDQKKIVEPDCELAEATSPLKGGGFQALVEDNPDWLFLTSMIERPGFEEFSIEFEGTHFPPDTEKNHEFQLIITEWFGLTWATLIFPDTYEVAAREVASKHGLVIKMGRRLVVFEMEGMPCLGAFDRDDEGVVASFPIPLRSNAGVIESTLKGPVGVVISSQGDRQ
jgi:hypothetical protein